ncbi:MAG: hypothetical protein AB2591_05740 [Candidatus Thiodiazotropha sp.]
MDGASPLGWLHFFTPFFIFMAAFDQLVGESGYPFYFKVYFLLIDYC